MLKSIGKLIVLIYFVKLNLFHHLLKITLSIMIAFVNRVKKIRLFRAFL